jgi:hypothetical protein
MKKLSPIFGRNRLRTDVIETILVLAGAKKLIDNLRNFVPETRQCNRFACKFFSIGWMLHSRNCLLHFLPADASPNAATKGAISFLF